MVIEQMERTWVIALPHSEHMGRPLMLYITEDYEGGKITSKDWSLWITRAKKFLTEDEAEQFADENGLVGAVIEERLWTTNYAVV